MVCSNLYSGAALTHLIQLDELQAHVEIAVVGQWLGSSTRDWRL